MGKETLTEAQITDLKVAFELFDKDKDGTISTEELAEVMKKLGTTVSEEEVKMLIADVDADHSGKIEFDEFLDVMAGKLSQAAVLEQEELMQAFKLFDENGDGKISLAELKKVMENLGEKMKTEDLEEMIKQADVDGDGQVNYTEFAKIMASH
ncbi:hypothetical protein CBR_g28538 [Chara braunii]|uniref:EF-hand domain-containing protein n=1 Tax=Chara braunii TaxID=69332 RepID=A0A388JW72_CHABU|nr:hypothetical protein CBR_g28538 [Chara braunii]|eukprot:GBG62061.1 hypothetical protein CBR_g28538 [Chara braunii]